jgi:hypothetical protein
MVREVCLQYNKSVSSILSNMGKGWNAYWVLLYCYVLVVRQKSFEDEQTRASVLPKPVFISNTDTPVCVTGRT